MFFPYIADISKLKVLTIFTFIGTIKHYYYIYIYIYIYKLCTGYQCFHIFQFLKFHFSSPFFPVDSFHVVNSLISHTSYFEVLLFFFFFFQTTVYILYIVFCIYICFDGVVIAAQSNTEFLILFFSVITLFLIFLILSIISPNS